MKLFRFTTQKEDTVYERKTINKARTSSPLVYQSNRSDTSDTPATTIMRYKVLNLLWYLFNLAMNIWQVQKLCSNYFRYDVTTDVRLYTPDEIEVPTVYACFPTERMINWTSLPLHIKKKVLTGMSVRPGIYEDETESLNMLHGRTNSVVVKNNIVTRFTIEELFKYTVPSQEVFPVVYPLQPPDR